MLIQCSTDGAGSFVSIFILVKIIGVVFRILCKTLKAIYVTG